MGQGGDAIGPPYIKEIPLRHACLPACLSCVSCVMPCRERAALYIVSIDWLTGWLALCDRIVPGVSRNSGECVECGIVRDDEIGGIVFVVYCRFG